MKKVKKTSKKSKKSKAAKELVVKLSILDTSELLALKSELEFLKQENTRLKENAALEREAYLKSQTTRAEIRAQRREEASKEIGHENLIDPQAEGRLPWYKRLFR